MSDDASAEADWHLLDGLHPQTSTFPVMARAGGEPLVVIATGKDSFRGVQRACPHLQESLADAVVMSQGTLLRCSKHNFIFKLADGKGVNCPGFRIKVFEVKAQDDRLYARRVC
jgi:nitrite reductase/ring-hydroxylating ferredoxin subunit